MADKKLRRCSGSSLNLRAEMNQNYVIVHDVSSNVSFEKYIQFARGSFDQAVKLYNKKDYQRAYVDFTKFHTFIKEKLPAHQGYDNGRSENAKIWLLQADEACVEFLEEISFQLDIIEDEKNHPNSRSVFLTEMQKHKVDIFVPEWIDPDSDDEGPVMQRNAPFNSGSSNHSHQHQPVSRSAFPNQHFTPPQMLHSNSLPVQQQHAQPHHHLQPVRQVSEQYSHHASQGHGHSESHGYQESHSSHGYSSQGHSHTLNHNNRSHTESQDLAQAIQESLQSANSVKSDLSAHTAYSSPSGHASYTSHAGAHSPYEPGHTFTRHAPESHHSHSPYAPHNAYNEQHAFPTQHLDHHHSERYGSDRSHSRSHSPVPPAQHYHDPYAHYGSVHSGAHGGAYSGDARAGYAQTGRASSVAKYVLPGLTHDDAAILRNYRAFTTFDIPAPTIANHTIHIGKHAFGFQQHDFHLSFAPFLRALPPELHMSRAAVEVNRCFFIHLGVATQLHPFALQSYFRHTAAAEKAIEEDWEQELARTISQYSGCVDANVLQYTWPADFDKYRILLVSGPASDPLLTCFVPTHRNRPVEDLYEVVVRNDRDHYTLLRPLANLTTKIKIIDQLLGEARQQHLVCQVCEVTSKPHRCVAAVLDQL